MYNLLAQKDMEEKKKKSKTSYMNKLAGTPKDPKNVNEPNSLFGNVFFYVFLAFSAFLLFTAAAAVKESQPFRPISEVVSAIKSDKVQDIKISGDTVTVLLRDGTSFVSKKESNISFDEILANNKVDASKIRGKLEVVTKLALDQILSPILFFALPIVLVFFIFRQMKAASGDITSFGRSRAKTFNKGSSKITFTDVAGNAEAKQELMEIVDFLKSPDKYLKLGARIPKGVLLVGSSGVGKTLLAKAIAGEANVPFYSVAGSEFMEMLVGVGSARARDLFRMAKETQPSLIFIDEIDAIGRQRGMGIGGGHDEREQTLNQILIEMDGFDPRSSVIVLAATNRPDMLDPALVRPGRFDRRISIPLPDLKDREEIVKIHMRGKPFTDEVNVEKVAKNTVGFSGADLENMLNESAILAARANKDAISQKDLEEASLKVTIGAERKTLQTDEEKKMTAYHEAGHAIVASNMPDMDKVNRVSIVARGGSLGHTCFPPERDRYNETKERLLAMICTALGGRAAEEIIFGTETIGASSDIDNATAVARKMVTEYGMSALGPIAYHSESRMGWLAKQVSNPDMISQEMHFRVDKEVEKIIMDCYAKAKEIIKNEKTNLDKVASALIEHETLSLEEYEALLK